MDVCLIGRLVAEFLTGSYGWQSVETSDVKRTERADQQQLQWVTEHFSYVFKISCVQVKSLDASFRIGWNFLASCARPHCCFLLQEFVLREASSTMKLFYRRLSWSPSWRHTQSYCTRLRLCWHQFLFESLAKISLNDKGDYHEYNSCCKSNYSSNPIEY